MAFVNCKAIADGMGAMFPGCCGSCHWDAEDGFYGGEMCSLYDEGASINAERYGEVCCAVKIALDNMPDEERATLIAAIREDRP